jgi:uncharacterized membrane protein
MVSKKIKIVFFISISILIATIGLLLFYYNSLPDKALSHTNFKGEIDGYDDKIHLWIATAFNIFILLFIWYLIRHPEKANYPIEVTEKNKTAIYFKMRAFLSILAIIVSTVFSIMVLTSLKIEIKLILYLLVSLISIPIIGLLFFKTKT